MTDAWTVTVFLLLCTVVYPSMVLAGVYLVEKIIEMTKKKDNENLDKSSNIRRFGGCD